MESFVQFIYDYGLIAIFCIILLEYACFPISSEIVLPFSGAAASLESLPFLLVLVVSVAAGLMGTSICYSIGRLGGNHLITRMTKRFPKTKKGIDASVTRFNKFGRYSVCIGRVIPICRTYIAFVAGACHQSVISFLISSAIGITVWNCILIGIGYIFRENWGLIGIYYARYKRALIPTLILILIFAYYFTAVRRARRKRNAKQ